MYVFLVELRREKGDAEIMLRQLQFGRRIKKSRDRRRRKIEDRLHTIVQQYDEYVNRGEVLNYSKTIGYYIQF